jgi:hypothetical protein
MLRMGGFDRAVAGRYRDPLLAVAGFAAIVLLAGCSDLKQAIGMDPVGPDEFAVESRAPLTIPPEFDLRPPQPGARPPHQVTAAEKARQAINTAGPGEPGKQDVPALTPEEGAGLSAQPETPQAVADNSLASKLLGASDNAAGGTVESRKTAGLEGVH